jgi:hypothetical protein
MKVEPILTLRATWLGAAFHRAAPVLSWVLPAVAGFFLGWFVCARRRPISKFAGVTVGAVPGTVGADEAVRRGEIVQGAVEAFTKWTGDKDAYTTELYRDWIRSGHVPDYATFDREMCRRVASELTTKGKGTVNPLLEVEYNGDWTEGQRQHNYLVGDLKLPR